MRLVFILLTVVCVIALFGFVDLMPRVDEKFFFSSRDRRFQQERQISKLFERRDNVIVIAAEGRIETEGYIDKVRSLSNDILRLPDIATLISITHGPGSFKHAAQSPLWSRLLVYKDSQSTNIIVILHKSYTKGIIPALERLIDIYQDNDFKVYISGAPYIVELIQRNLARDLRLFSLLAYLAFGIMIFLIFRSVYILLGALTACTISCALTLMLCNIFNIPIGVLTANLVTIVFMLTLEPIIFMTYDWKHLCRSAGTGLCVDKAAGFTFSASFWSMFTTLLGFLSLLAVPAKPLHELGVAGGIGSVIAISAAFSIYPSFLRLVDARRSKAGFIEEKEHAVYLALARNRKYIIAGILVGCVAVSFFIHRINTDPSLLSYFKKDSKITEGLQYIDKNSGSNPLLLVVEAKSGGPLNTGLAYKELWGLQKALEKEKTVGIVISLPVILGEAKRAPFAFLMPLEFVLSILEKPNFGRVARTFITEDRKKALFFLMMKEGNRFKPRLEILEEIKQVVEKNRFSVKIEGGVFLLQGHLSSLVASSLVFGIGRLLIIFFIISLMIARSFKIGLAMILTFCLMPLGILGIIGLMHLPLDIISAPASNLAISMDTMFYMVKDYRRKKASGATDKGNWEYVEKKLWQPTFILLSVLVTGFCIFLFSQFPPTQRFGFSIILGSVIATLASLFVMPFIARVKI